MASTIPSFLLFTQNKLITTTAIHRSMKNSFPPLRHAAALLGCFLTHRHAGYRWELSRRQKKQQKNNSNSNNSNNSNNSINNSNLSLLLIFFRPDRSLRKSHFLCGVYWFAFNQSKTLNKSILPEVFFGDHIADKEPKWARDWEDSCLRVKNLRLIFI